MAAFCNLGGSLVQKMSLVSRSIPSLMIAKGYRHNAMLGIKIHAWSLEDVLATCVTWSYTNARLLHGHVVRFPERIEGHA